MRDPFDFLERLVVQQGRKPRVVQTFLGNVHINIEAIQALKRKTWRPLSTFTYPSQRVEDDLQHSYPAHLITQLHKTFRTPGYTAFTSILSIAGQTLKNMDISAVALTTNQAAYVGAIHASVKRLWDLKDLDRLALQNALNRELDDLYSNWDINVSIHPDPGPIAYQFTYDPDTRKIVIVPHKISSAAPSEYPDKAANTSELLMLMTAIMRAMLRGVPMMAGNMETILHSYQLSKLFLEVLDKRTISLGKVRVNDVNVEEWDYDNPAADEDFGLFAGH